MVADGILVAAMDTIITIGASCDVVVAACGLKFPTTAALPRPLASTQTSPRL
jgi:hypothetical protein